MPFRWISLRHFLNQGSFLWWLRLVSSWPTTLASTVSKEQKETSQHFYFCQRVPEYEQGHHEQREEQLHSWWASDGCEHGDSGMPLSHAGKDKGTHRDMTVKFLQLANFETISSWLINSHRSSHSRNVTLRPTFSPDHMLSSQSGTYRLHNWSIRSSVGNWPMICPNLMPVVA